MDIDEKFSFGLYKGLTLKQVYQGTLDIDKKFFKSFLLNTLLDKNVPKPIELNLCDLIISENKIVVNPQIFNEEKTLSPENIIHLGNLSQVIEIYFNHFLNKNWYGIIENIETFNHGRFVIGGNPEYITWCITNIKDFNIEYNTIRNLEQLQVYRLIGIQVKMTNINKYSYEPNIVKEFYSFKIK